MSETPLSINESPGLLLRGFDLQNWDLQTIQKFTVAILTLAVVYQVSIMVYNVFFHPLSKFPGPRLAAASHLPFVYHSVRGEIVPWMTKLHETYGETVRTNPDSLSFTNSTAWKDIYGHTRAGGRKVNTKDLRFYGKPFNGAEEIITIRGEPEHGRLRKIFANAFSDKALRLQEGMISRYVNKMVENMQDAVAKGNGEAALDMVKLYNFTTFDIMGDLAFGESLGMLESNEYTPWVRSVFGGVKAASLVTTVTMRYPALKPLWKMMVPKGIRDMEKAHFQNSADRVDRRLEKGREESDIWNLVLTKGEDTMTLGEMHANSSTFIIAGTETTATLLSGLTNLLLQHPDKMQKVLKEVRAVASDEELNLNTLPQMSYLNACFEEGLRKYPPIPQFLPRMTPEGGNIIVGQFVPAHTQVVVPQFAINHNPSNFRDPYSFIPERWLPNSGYDSDRKEAMQAFSTGPRNCLGKNLAYHEMRLIMAKVLWNFDLTLNPESQGWENQKTFVLWEKPELWVTARSVR